MKTLNVLSLSQPRPNGGEKLTFIGDDESSYRNDRSSVKRRFASRASDRARKKDRLGTEKRSCKSNHYA